MSLFSAQAAPRLVDSLAIAFSQAYQVARVRLASATSPVLRLLVQRDDAVFENKLQRREMAVLRGQRAEAPPHQRAEYSPHLRLEILQIKRLRGWNLAETAQRFVIHENTIRHWMQAAEGKGSSSLLTGSVVWNKIDDVVRHAVHELRRLCPEPEFGTRALARELVKAAIQISRSSVQRILREPPPEKPKVPAVKKPELRKPLGGVPDRLLAPTKINEVWHMDFVQVQVLWMTFYVAAILDGFSRKLLTFRVYRQTPRTRNALVLVRRTVQQHGKPSYMMTDNGCQFRQRFKEGIESKLGIKLVQGPVRSPHWNGKVERVFRTFRLWWCVVPHRLHHE